MKTLVLATVSAAALLAAGAASAQSANNVDAGISNLRSGLNAITVENSHLGTGGVAALYDSKSYVAQVGNQNTANIDQQTAGSAGGGAVDANYGNPQSSVVLQGWGGGRSDYNTANVSQKGTNQVSVVMQRNYPTADFGSNSANVSQEGSNKNAFTYQYGRENRSMVLQSGDDTTTPSSSVKDSATANSGGSFAMSFHGIDGTQSHLNDAGGRVIQDEAQNNNAGLSQAGADLKGTIVQWYGERNTANVYQTGTNNSAISYQTGKDSNIGISQSSSNNKASVYQVSGDQDGSAYGVVGADDSYANTAVVNQSAAGGTALVLQGGSSNFAGINQSGLGTESATIRQVGMDNYATIDQAGYGNPARPGGETALTMQAGFNNRATVRQSSAGDYSLIEQNGTNNVANVTQAIGGASNSYFPVSKIDQSGANNNANVYQTGRSTYSELTQAGQGATNYATINQSAYNAVSYGFQTGGGNVINVNQR